MAVIIPNAGDTTSGNKYESLDQAEPDALDFEILGNAYTGVLDGCVVSSNASPSNVAVTAGTIILDGVPYAVSANLTLALPVAPSDNRFDIVIARVSSGTASLTVVSGDDSGTNPSFPRSVNLISGGGSPSSNIYPSTDVVLAAIYRSGSSAVTSSRIVDKRAIRNTGIMFQGTSVPSPAEGVGTGQFYFDTSEQDGAASGAYVKRSDGSWASLALDVGAHFPIGGVFAWPINAPTPTGCVDASGQSESTDNYPALFEVYGYAFGGSGNSFTMPQFNDDCYLIGTSTGGTIGTATGTNSYSLTVGQLPSHRHTHTHTHTLVHTHNVNVPNFTGVNSGSQNANHTHNTENLVERLTPATKNQRDVWLYFSDAVEDQGYFDVNGTSVESGLPYTFRLRSYAVKHGTKATGTNSVSHQHTINHDHEIFSSDGASTSTTNDPNDSNTSYVGSGTAIDNKPKSRYVKWVIRASLGDDPTYTGGTPAFTAAYQETFVVELFAEGESVSADTSLGTSFRMPWAGTITDVRASTGVPSDTGPIVIDVNEGGTVASPGSSILSTKLSIDQNEYSSYTATTPHVISDNSFADDALVTFDVDSAGANAEGPLTVTLYITRDS